MQDVSRFLDRLVDRSFYGNSLADWLAAFIVAIAVFYVLHWVRGQLARRLKARALPGGRLELVAEVAHRINALWLLVLAFGAGAYTLDLPGKVVKLVQSIELIALFAQLAILASYLFTAWAERHAETQRQRDPAVATAMGAVTVFGRIAIFALALLLALDNLGFDVTALLAGLGIGGIAIAIASQSILGDLFASLSIVFDKPFVVGDFIVLDSGFMGSVERVGVKTTRLRSLSGEQIIISNADLLKTRIRNFKQMYERRVMFSVEATYETPMETLQQAPALIKSIIEAQPRTRFDRAHFKELGASGLVFEAVYFVTVPEFNAYMDIQQAINLEIMRRFADAGIDFAYPTRKLHVTTQMPAADPAKA